MKNKSRRRSDQSDVISLRLRPEFRELIDAAIGRMPYPPSIEIVIQRGLELALAEMESLARKEG